MLFQKKGNYIIFDNFGKKGNYMLVETTRLFDNFGRIHFISEVKKVCVISKESKLHGISEERKAMYCQMASPPFFPKKSERKKETSNKCSQYSLTHRDVDGNIDRCNIVSSTSH